MKKKFKLIAGIVGGLTVICGSAVAIVSCSTNPQKTTSTDSSSQTTSTAGKTSTTDGNSNGKSTTGSSVDNSKSASTNNDKTATGSNNSGGKSSSTTGSKPTVNNSSSTSANSNKTTTKPTVKLYQIPSNLTNGYDKSINNGNYVEANGFNDIKNTVVKVLNEMKNELTTMLTDSNALISRQTGFMPSNNPFIIDNQQKIIGYTDGNQIAVYQYDATMTTAIQSIEYLLSAFNTTIQFSSSVWPKYYENVTSAILQTFGTWLQNIYGTYSFPMAVGLVGTSYNDQSTMYQLSENIKAFIQQNPDSEYKRLNTSNNAFLQNAVFLYNYDNQIFDSSNGFFYGNMLPPDDNTTSNDLIVQWLSFIQIVNQ